MSRAPVEDPDVVLLPCAANRFRGSKTAPLVDQLVPERDRGVNRASLHERAQHQRVAVPTQAGGRLRSSLSTDDLTSIGHEFQFVLNRTRRRLQCGFVAKLRLVVLDVYGAPLYTARGRTEGARLTIERPLCREVRLRLSGGAHEGDEEGCDDNADAAHVFPIPTLLSARESNRRCCTRRRGRRCRFARWTQFHESTRRCQT